MEGNGFAIVRVIIGAISAVLGGLIAATIGAVVFLLLLRLITKSR